MAKQKYYVVWDGLKPGIYTSWADCQAQIKGYNGAKYKAFESPEEAAKAFKGNFNNYIGASAKKTTAKVPKSSAGIVWDSISVDAACSGNPGVMEYQGVDTKTKEQLFHMKFSLGTNNIGEFLAIVHALALFKKHDVNKPIYTDSMTALSWVKKKKVKTNLERTKKTEELYELIARAELWLKNNEHDIALLKWETKGWGEIPADFGRK